MKTGLDKAYVIARIWDFIGMLTLQKRRWSLIELQLRPTNLDRTSLEKFSAADRDKLRLPWVSRGGMT